MADARQQIPYAEEWELPWEEQTLAARAAQAISIAVHLDEGDTWGGSISQAVNLIGALRELEGRLLAHFEEGWGSEGRYSCALVRQWVSGRAQ